jgi:hypothetical protein
MPLGSSIHFGIFFSVTISRLCVRPVILANPVFFQLCSRGPFVFANKYSSYVYFNCDSRQASTWLDLTEDQHLSCVALSIELLVGVYTATCVSRLITTHWCLRGALSTARYQIITQYGWELNTVLGQLDLCQQLTFLLTSHISACNNGGLLIREDINFCNSINNMVLYW